MQKIFYDTRVLDRNVRENYLLSEELMMENAAASLQKVVEDFFEDDKSNYINRPSILILTGSGNNGADGYALARRLNGHGLSITVCELLEAKSQLAVVQKSRAEKIGVSFINLYDLDDFIESKSIDLKVVVDCIFGTGFHGSLPYECAAAVESINKVTDAYKIACDVPSGIDLDGNVNGTCFAADTTVSMGALKLNLFSDKAKDLCGKIIVADLGVTRENYENAIGSEGGTTPSAFLVEQKDVELPERKKQNVNKGSFGHAVVIGGDKCGAAVIASSAALRIGAGLVTIVHDEDVMIESGSKVELDEDGFCSEENSAATKINVPYEIMCGTSFPDNTTSVALGMGFGRTRNAQQYIEYVQQKNIPLVLDADIVYNSAISEILKTRSECNAATVITPHPKEFAVLLENCGLGKLSVKEVVEKRVELCKSFCRKFPGVVLLLKGANVIVAVCQNDEVKLYFNTYGTSALAKAGSGDVLTGLIAGLLAQKKNPLDAAITATVYHGCAGQKAETTFGLTPFKLLKLI